MLERYQRNNVRFSLGSAVDPKPSGNDYVHLWSSRPDVAAIRRAFLCQWILGYIPLWIVIFIMCAFYFGAGVDPYNKTHNIGVDIVNFDQGEASNVLIDAFQSTPPGSLTLRWQYKSASDLDNRIEKAPAAVTDGTVWASVVLRPNVTAIIERTLSSLVQSTETLTYPFAKTLPIQVIYEEGRNTFAQNNFILPAIRSAIATASQSYSEMLRARAMSMLSSTTNPSINRTLQRQNILRLRRLFSDPLVAEYYNVHPASPFVGKSQTTVVLTVQKHDFL